LLLFYTGVYDILSEQVYDDDNEDDVIHDNDIIKHMACGHSGVP